MSRWIRVPVIEPMDYRRCNVYEHTPLDFYRYGEYPRDINPVGGHPPRAEWALGAPCPSSPADS